MTGKMFTDTKLILTSVTEKSL